MCPDGICAPSPFSTFLETASDEGGGRYLLLLRSLYNWVALFLAALANSFSSAQVFLSAWTWFDGWHVALHFTNPSFLQGENLFLERQESSLENLDSSSDDPCMSDKILLLVLALALISDAQYIQRMEAPESILYYTNSLLNCSINCIGLWESNNHDRPSHRDHWIAFSCWWKRRAALHSQPLFWGGPEGIMASKGVVVVPPGVW